MEVIGDTISLPTCLFFFDFATRNMPRAYTVKEKSRLFHFKFHSLSKSEEVNI